MMRLGTSSFSSASLVSAARRGFAGEQLVGHHRVGHATPQLVQLPAEPEVAAGIGALPLAIDLGQRDDTIADLRGRFLPAAEGAAARAFEFAGFGLRGFGAAPSVNWNDPFSASDGPRLTVSR